MLRSLVGSEMCIRDSHINGAHADLEWLAVVVNHRCVQRLIEVLALDRDCLLYTSDAADDLLCVDLGGRRIIKKKKHVCRIIMHRVAHELSTQ